MNGTIVYFSHGGGPLPILGDKSHKAMIDFMQTLPTQISKPDAVLVISAHWEEAAPTVLGNPDPSMFYDYYGFPEEAYTIRYPSPGNPELAGRITQMLSRAGIESRLDTARGIDHGVYIPMMMMYPEADIPTIQISLIKGLNPAAHISLGKALQQLLQENILIIGSGFSFHNMRAFDWSGSNIEDKKNNSFQDWLIKVCTETELPEQQFTQLTDWDKAPGARYCHPREEHLLPLHVCAGIAGSSGRIIFDDYILGKRAVAVLWQ